MPIYDKPVRVLMHDMIGDLGVKPGDVTTRDQVLQWFGGRYPRIKDATITAHLIRMSVNARSRVHHNPKAGEDDLFFQLDGGRYRLYDPAIDPAPIRNGGTPPLPPNPDVEPATEFAYEADLRNFLSKNLHAIERGLRLYEDDGVRGIEFPAGGRFIDILAVDKNDDYVVIELKVSRGYDRTVGQLRRYVGWIQAHHAEANQRVRGIIVAREISEDLILACSGMADVQLFEYELSVAVKPVTSRKPKSGLK